MLHVLLWLFIRIDIDHAQYRRSAYNPAYMRTWRLVLFMDVVPQNTASADNTDPGLVSGQCVINDPGSPTSQPFMFAAR